MTVPVEILAAAPGHVLESDPPWGLTAAQRWTCTACGDAVLRYNGNVYGSATKSPCAEVAATEVPTDGGHDHG